MLTYDTVCHQLTHVDSELKVKFKYLTFFSFLQILQRILT